jgi:UDP-glucose 4-epimerase
MFGGNIEILPERRGNRMSADVLTEKTKNLGWKAQKNIKEYIDEMKSNNWK